MSPFSFALFDPGAALPPGLIDPQGRSAGRRFDVYRNNVVVSLTEALAAGFPVILKLVGEDFFRAMAGVFVRAHPPVSPVLMTYGTAFPAFLESFSPVAHLPYLADVARLELALRESYHAADVSPLGAQALQAPGLMQATLTFSPAARLLASPYPIHAIWRANCEVDAPPARGGAETVLVTRPGYDPVPSLVAPDTARFLAALMAGKTFGTALEAAGERLDLAAALALLLRQSALTAITEPA